MAEAKPIFDPSQPFDPAPNAAPSKPAFDPTKAFEPASAKDAPPTQSEAVRIPLGVAQGVAEVMHPANWPGTAERAYRAFGPPALVDLARGKVDTSHGMMGTILSRLDQADKDSYFPMIPVDKLAAGARTVMDALHESPDHLDTNRIKQLYGEEMKAQADYNHNFINPTAEKAGEIGAGVASVGSLANDIANGLGAAPKLKALSNESYVAALKPTKAQLQILQEGNKVQPLGEELAALNRSKIVPASWSSMSGKVNQELNDWGQQIGHFAKTADQAVARDSAVRGVLVDDIRSQVSNDLIPQLIQNGKTSVAQDVQNFVDKNIVPAASGSGELGFQQTQKIKQTIQQMKAKFGTANDTPTKDAFQDLYGIVNNLHEQGIENALTQGGSEESLAQFQKAKEKYGLYKTASDVLNKTLARQGANRLFSLSDYIMGAHQAAEGAVNANPEQTLKGLGLAIANKLARERGNQALGSMFDRLSQKPDLLSVRGAANVMGATAGTANSLPQSRGGNP